LPDPIPDGFAKLLNAAFEADEYVAISEAKPDGAGNLVQRPGAFSNGSDGLTFTQKASSQKSSRTKPAFLSGSTR